MSDFLGMSDDDFMKQNTPEGQPVQAPTQETQPQSQTVPEATVPEETKEQTTEAPQNPTPETQEMVEDKPTDTPKTTEPEVTEPLKEAPVATPEGGKEPVAPTDTTKPKETATEAAPPNYEDFYKQIMTPFKANGKMIELKNPQEAIQLMQMGANYTQRMQQIAPHRKMLMMLESNGLLNEDKISFLIDIEKKNPEAIKKLVKESGLDPMDIDTSVEPAYKQGDHRVSDEDVAFRTVLDDMLSSEPGLKTLQAINSDWDEPSKEVLYKNPNYVRLIHEQREAGIYDRIHAEVARQKLLGSIKPEVPFLQAYKEVGDRLVEAGAFNDLIEAHTANTAPPVRAPVPVATRVAAPKPAVTNNDKASAAAPTRANPPKVATPSVNPLAVSDEEFTKNFAQWAGRL